MRESDILHEKSHGVTSQPSSDILISVRTEVAPSDAVDVDVSSRAALPNVVLGRGLSPAARHDLHGARTLTDPTDHQ